MPSLRDLQEAVRNSIVERDDLGAIMHIVADEIAPQERLAVYRNTFEQTLIRALRLSYPAVDRLVGVEFFDAAVREFIAQQPPRSSYLDEFGGDFAAFLEQFTPAASVPYLADVARLEWAVSCAIHAPDAAALTVTSLAAVDAADHARVCFVPNPSVGLLETTFPAEAIWRAVLDDDDAALAAIDLSSGPAWLVVQRGEAGIEIVQEEEAVWRFVSALCEGCPLGRALDEHPGINATAVLADLLAHGHFVRFRLAGPSDAFQPSMGVL